MDCQKTADNMRHDCTPLIFGEVLFDCFPDGREVLGGAPFNVTWNLQAFCMSPLLVSRVGADSLGRRILEKMKLWGMNPSCLQVDPSYPTGKVRIELTKDEPRFTILPDQAYDYIVPITANLQHEPSFLYHGSLATRNAHSRSALSHLKQHYQCPIFVDVNLRTPWWNAENVHSLVQDASWLKLNEGELDALFPGPGSLEQKCRQILERFDLEAIFVTLGKNGAVALNSENHLSKTRPNERITIKDTVGAGDAFSSVLLLGFMHSWAIDTTMLRAQEFASAVVGLRGAITDDRNFYQTFCEKWDLQWTA